MTKQRRRGRGEGNIRERSDGRWEARVSLGFKPNGQRLVKSIYGSTYDEVLKLRDEFKADVRGGLRHGQAPGRGTLGEFLSMWLEESVQPTVAPVTYADYSTQVRKHITPALGPIPLAQLAGFHVQSAVNQMHRDGYSRRSVAVMRDVLRIALNKARRWGLVTRNAAAEIDLPRAEHKEMQVYTLKEARAFLVALEGERLQALYITTLALGLRRGEVLGLRWSDVDLERGILTVRQTVQRLDGALRIQGAKTAGSYRTHKLPAVVVEALIAHGQRQALERNAARVWGSYDLVFCTSAGGPIDPRNLLRSLERLLKKAGLPKVTLHGLRHTIATLLLDEGMSDMQIADWLSHSSPAVTRQVYLHHTEARRKRTAGQVDEIFGHREGKEPGDKSGAS